MRSALVFAALAVCAALLSANSTTTANRAEAVARDVRIPVGGAELYAREIGHGTPIIVLHGGPDFDHSYLVPDLDRLATSYRLIYYDQRGRGRSAEHVRLEDVSLASDLADLDKVREYFHLDQVVLLGHSWGTVLALEYSLRHPDRVSHLILMNPAPASAADYKQLRNDWLEHRAEDMEKRKAIAATDAYKNGDPEAVTAYYRIHFKPAFARSEEYDRFMSRLSASFTSEGVLKARAIESRLMSETLSQPGYDLLPKLKDLRIPSLVITGDHEFIPVSTAEHIAGAIPNAHLVMLKNCGHFSYMECPAPVRENIDALLTK
jgi:proline iminopeptidase